MGMYNRYTVLNYIRRVHGLGFIIINQSNLEY